MNEALVAIAVILTLAVAAFRLGKISGREEGRQEQAETAARLRRQLRERVQDDLPQVDGA